MCRLKAFSSEVDAGSREENASNKARERNQDTVTGEKPFLSRFGRLLFSLQVSL